MAVYILENRLLSEDLIDLIWKPHMKTCFNEIGCRDDEFAQCTRDGCFEKQQTGTIRPH